MSGWLLSEQKEEKIDDFVEELETMGFWVKGRRENLAKDLLKSIDLINAYHCEMKFESSEELTLHKSKCGLRPVNCANEGCREVFSAVYAEKHDESCPLKLCMAFIHHFVVVGLWWVSLVLEEAHWRAIAYHSWRYAVVCLIFDEKCLYFFL